MKTIAFTLVSLVLVGCGSSVQPEQPREETPPVTTPPDNTNPTPKRVVINRPLLSGSPQNLLLDVGFRDAGWGHFTTFFGGGSSLAQIASRTFSLAPASVTAPVGIFKDPAADDTKSKGMVSVCSFLGGKGPFIARVWVARTTVAGEPLDLEDDPLVFRAALTTGGYPEGKAYDLARRETKRIGKLDWVLFEAEVEADLPSTAFFNLSFGRKGGGYMVTAPEVVAVNLLPPGDSAMSFMKPASLRAVTFDESSAIAAYRRQPHPLGAPKPTSTKVVID